MSRTNFPGGITSQGVPLPQGILGTGTHYFVDPAVGADSNSGLSSDFAFKTLAQAKLAVTTHDVVYIIGGGLACLRRLPGQKTIQVL